jgi:acetyltransferase-like isoleucine patch superfamily enzyme
MGDGVVIDDNCCLDAKGTTNTGITLRNGVFIGRNTMLSCKNGDITLDEGANIGINVGITSSAKVRIGARALIAAYTYFVGGDHLHDRVDIPILDQGRTAQGIDIGDGVWLGSHVVVTDGVRIGRDAIVGAGAIVRDDVPEFHVAAGVPARVIKDRRRPDAGTD